MKQFKKMKKVWAFLLALVMVLSVIPADAAWAADTYAVKCVGEKKIVACKGSCFSLGVVIYKNGKDVTSSAGKVKWKTSNAQIVKLRYGSGVGDFEAKKNGKVTITASYKGKSCSYEVRVRNAAICVGESNSINGYVPAGQTISVRTEGLGTGKITYGSSNSKVAKVVNGKYGTKVIKGLKEGTATITAKSKSGVVKCTVKVLPAMKLQIQNLKDVKQNGEIVGYSCDITNHGSKKVVINMGMSHAYEGGDMYFCKLKEGSVTINPGQKKTITAYSYEGLNGPGFLMTYEGHEFYAEYNESSKSFECFGIRSN